MKFDKAHFDTFPIVEKNAKRGNYDLTLQRVELFRASFSYRINVRCRISSSVGCLTHVFFSFFSSFKINYSTQESYPQTLVPASGLGNFRRRFLSITDGLFGGDRFRSRSVTRRISERKLLKNERNLRMTENGRRLARKERDSRTTCVVFLLTNGVEIHVRFEIGGDVSHAARVLAAERFSGKWSRRVLVRRLRGRSIPRVSRRRNWTKKNIISRMRDIDLK